MRPRRIILEYPDPWLVNSNDGDRTKIFFDNVLRAICLTRIPVTLKLVPFNSQDYERVILQDEICFSYHYYIPFSKRKNHQYTGIYSLKEAPISSYYSIDRYGFSGWSSICNSSDFSQQINDIDISDAENTIAETKDRFLLSGESKYTQKSLDKDLVKGEYVFFPLQVQNDPVSELSPFTGIQLLKKAAEVAKEKNIKLVVKRHPFCKQDAVVFTLNDIINNNPWVEISDANIHLLNKNAKSVIAVNSGASLEALIIGSRVYNSGLSEWWDAVNHIESLDDVEKAFIDKENELDDYQKKLIAFLIKNFWVHNSDFNSIRDHINRCIDEFDNNNQNTGLNSGNIFDVITEKLLIESERYGKLKRQNAALKIDLDYFRNKLIENGISLKGVNSQFSFLKYIKYKILSKITFGFLREKYKLLYKFQKNLIKN